MDLDQSNVGRGCRLTLLQLNCNLVILPECVLAVMAVISQAVRSHEIITEDHSKRVQRCWKYVLTFHWN